MKRTVILTMAMTTPLLLAAFGWGQSQINNGGTGGGGGGAFNTITSGANSATLTETTGGSLVPAQTAATTGLGQITGLTNWLTLAPTQVFPPEPTLTASNTGGSLTQATYFFRLTYVGLSVTVPSGEIRATLNSTNCASNSTCQITVTMPSSCQAGGLPSGATGCTVWDATATPNTELQQAASNACVNITTATCVVNVKAAGSALTFPVSTGVTCPNLQSQTIADKIIPIGYMVKDNGNCYPEFGIDGTALNVITDIFTGGTQPAWATNANGTFTWTDRFFVSDKTSNPAIAITNSLVSITHESGNTTGTLTAAGAGIDDRALSVRWDNDTTASPHYEQILAQYNEAFMDNNSTTCNPIGTENCMAGGRFVAADFRTAGTLSVTTTIAGVAGSFFREPSSPATPYSSCSPCGTGVFGSATNLSSGTNLGSNFFAGGTFVAGDTGASTNGFGVGVYVAAPTSYGGARFSGGNYGLYMPAAWNNASDLQLRIDGTAPSRLHGTIQFYAMQSNAGALPITNGLTTSGIATTQVANTVLANQTIAAIGTTGASSNTYKLVYKDAGGGQVVQTGAGLTINTANANLTATNLDRITFSNVVNSNLCTLGIASIDIYRTANASQCNGIACTTGKIGNFPITDCTTAFTSQTFDDTGIQGDATTPPTVNTTGTVNAWEYATNTNCAVNSVSPAACGSAAAGAFVIPTTTTTYVVNTSAVTAHSRILLTPLTFAADLPSAPTCVVPVNTTEPSISAISAGVSFTVALGSTTGQTCFQYMIVN